MEKKFGNFKDCLEHLQFDSTQRIGRRNKYPDDDEYLFPLCDPFSVDETKIMLSKAYRRMERKTQVFYSRRNPHSRTRIIHTAESAALASIISETLGLNASLCRAIAFAHDIGHVPFGHLGERFLSKKLGVKFKHNAFAVMVSEFVERSGKGLNLCYETLEGVYHHSGGIDNFNEEDLPQEYLVVKIADKVAYTLADLNDAIRLRFLKEPPSVFKELGKNQRQRTENILLALFEESCEEGKVSFKECKESQVFKEARSFLFENVYAMADKEVDMNVLEDAYTFLEETKQFKGNDPAISFAFLTESEIESLSLMKRKGEDSDLIERMGISEMLPMETSFSDLASFPFRKEEFSKAK